MVETLAGLGPLPLGPHSGDFFSVSEDFDLFGNPLATTSAKRGRPVHVPTEENIIVIMVLLAAGYPNKRVADTVGLSVPTLRKNYFHLIKHRDVMRDRLRAKLMANQIQMGLANNASALAGALKMIEKIDLENNVATHRQKAQARVNKEKKLGKKELALQAARSPNADSPIGRLMAQRSGTNDQLN